MMLFAGVTARTWHCQVVGFSRGHLECAIAEVMSYGL